MKAVTIVLLSAVAFLGAHVWLAIPAVAAPAAMGGCHEHGAPANPSPAPTSHDCCVVGHSPATLPNQSCHSVSRTEVISLLAVLPPAPPQSSEPFRVLISSGTSPTLSPLRI